MEKILIKYHDDEMERLEKIEIGDWIDLRASEEFVLKGGEFALIPLGISMKLPEGYEANIVPRSSTFGRWGIIQTNSMGVIDNSYSGTNDIWKFPVLCLQPRGFLYSDGTWDERISVIHKGSRICQFRIVKKQPDIEFEEVDVLDVTDRGGFGSSGVM